MTRSAAETTLSILQAEREALSRSQNASSSEAETLKLLVAEHDREKRDLIGVIDRLRSDDEQRDGQWWQATIYFILTRL